MVNATKGVMITCDPAIKQFILHLDKTEHFGMIDLDDTHLFLYAPENQQAGIISKIQAHIDHLQDENTYSILYDKQDQ